MLLNLIVNVPPLEHFPLLLLVGYFCNHFVGDWVDFLEAAEILELKLLKFFLLFFHFELILLLCNSYLFFMHVGHLVALNDTFEVGHLLNPLFLILLNIK